MFTDDVGSCIRRPDGCRRLGGMVGVRDSQYTYFQQRQRQPERPGRAIMASAFVLVRRNFGFADARTLVVTVGLPSGSGDLQTGYQLEDSCPWG